MAGIIYADHAATTQLDSAAFEAMKPFLLGEYGNASQPYSFARPAKKALKDARETIAKCINAEPDEIYFTSGGTESDNWAIKAMASVYGDYRATITSQIEHHAVLNACSSVEKMGYPVVYLPVTTDGVVQPNSLQDVITQNTKLVSIMFANNEIGSIQPIKELSTIAHKNGAIFHTDAVQVVGHLSINVKALGVDMLSASAHKFNGPKGIGFLYIKNGIGLSPLLSGGSQEFGKRAGTENIASIVGMAVALENSCNRMLETTDKLQRLEKCLLRELKAANLDFILNGSHLKIPGNISLSFKDTNGEMLLHRLDLMGICVSTGSACDSTTTQVSHVLQAIKVPNEYIEGTIRITLGYENTEEDVLKIAKSLAKILKR